PVTASFKRKDAFSITTALAYIRKISDPDIIFYSDGFNIVVRKDEKCELPLSEILPLFSNIKKIPCEYYCTMVAGDLKDFIKYFDGYLDPLNFPLLVEYINSRITLKESVQTISSRMHELSVSNISAVNEKLLEKAYRSKVEIFFYFKGLKRNLISIMIPYYDPKEGRITFNEVMAYFKSRIKDFHYLLFYQGRDTITINNVDDKECIIDLSKLTSSIGGPDDHGLRSTGYIHMQRNKKFSKERFAKINYLNFSEFVDHIKERISEELDLQNKE
ncbi:MAG: hypothetical protein KKH98_10335, partial [Spirochaetes bacterium]|nr:hypothetical protein [Spirochaetota bacterium]